MSRFGNLEFGDESDERARASQPARASDETRHLDAAHAAFTGGEFERALRLYSKVLEFNPASAAAWTGQVRMLIELDELREAKVWADKALESFPHEPELLAAKAVALARLGDLQAALTFSDAAMEELGETPYLWLARGDVLLAAKAVALARLGDLQAALTFSDAAMEELGETPYLWLARGDVLLARKEARADYCFEKAFLLAPDNWFVTWLAARIRMFHEHFVLALKLLQQAIEQNAGLFMLWLDLGRCQQALGLANPARHSFKQALQLNRDCAGATAALRQLDEGSTWSEKLQGWWRKQFKR